MMLLVVLRLFSVDLMPTEIGVRYVVASVMWSVRQTTRQGTINSLIPSLGQSSIRTKSLCEMDRA
jgi:hypothetical protein